MTWIWLLCMVPSPEVVTDTVAISELNHVCCPETGAIRESYWVWWRWQRVEGVTDYYVADWIRLSECPRPENGVQEFWDKKAKVKRRIESRVFVETWSNYDRESEDRKRLPENMRRKLTSVHQR